MVNFVLYLRFFISGIAFGIANVIPGVSGGTMLVVFGIYDKLTEAISGVKSIIRNFWFLLCFGLGAVTGIVAFAFVITWLFESFGVQTNMFFIGLILGSIPIIVRTATAEQKIKPLCALPFIVGLAAAVGLSLLESGGAAEQYRLETKVNNDATYVTIHNDSSRYIDSWEIEFDNEDVVLDYDISGATAVADYSTVDRIKMALGMKVPAKAPDMLISPDDDSFEIAPGESYTIICNGALDEATMSLAVRYRMDVGFFITMLAALFIAAVAMIIPGVSGSFVMMLLGVYTTVIGAIKELDILILIPGAIGAVLGIMLGAKLISTMLKKHSLMVYSGIMGLVIGSVYAILPEGFGFNLSTGYGFITFIFGILLSLLIDRIGKGSENNA